MQTDAVGEWSWPLSFSADSARAARVHVATVLRSFDVQQATVEDACAVASELVGNATRHARPRSDGQIVLTMAVDEASVSIYVADGGSVTLPALVRPTLWSLGGRGLGIVHALTHKWGVREAAEGNTVFGVVNRT